MISENSKFAFLSSTRFWALIIGGLAIVAEGNFTVNAWMNGLITVVVGFTAVRTVDRVSDKKIEVAQIENE